MKITFQNINIQSNPVFLASKAPKTSSFSYNKTDNDSFIKKSFYISSKNFFPIASKSLFELNCNKPKIKTDASSVPLPALYQDYLDSYKNISKNRYNTVHAIMQKDILDAVPFSESTNFYSLLLDSDELYDDDFFDTLAKRNLISPEKIYASLCLGNLTDSEWERVKDIDFEILDLIVSSVDFDDAKAFASGEISYDEIIRRTSKESLSSLFSVIPSQYTDKIVDDLLKILEKGDVNSSNFELLLQLVKEDKISLALAMNLIKSAKANQNAADDLDKLFDAYINNKNPKDAFVPEFESDEEAFSSLEIGDVYHIQGRKNINIITNNERKKEIALSKETYLELFPPVERYSYAQQAQGNCWFVSTLNSIYSNPKTRLEILRCFKENDDGTLDICLYGYETRNGKSVKIKPNSFEFQDVGRNFSDKIKNNRMYYSATCEGLRLLEEAYEKGQEAKAFVNIKQKYRQFSELSQKSPNQNVMLNGFEYSKEEVEEFLQLAKQSVENPNLAPYLLIDTARKPLFVNKDMILEKMQTLSLPETKEKFSEEQLERLERVLLRYKKYFDSQNENNLHIMPHDILPFDIYFALFHPIQTKPPEINPYSYSGSHSEALSLFGFSPQIFNTHYADDVINFSSIILPLKNSSDVILLASTSNEKNCQAGLVDNHGYCVNFDKNNGKIKFLIKDPINTFCEKRLTLKEFLNSFEYITLAYPKY